MKEKDFQTKFGHWLKANWDKSSVFELKLVKSLTMPFSVIADHQLSALFATFNNNIYYKIPDAGYQNPYDCIFLKQIPAYIVIMFYRRGQTEFIMIDINTFITEKNSSNRKSLTELRAKEIGMIYNL
jgi:hypothetical protein